MRCLQDAIEQRFDQGGVGHGGVPVVHRVLADHERGPSLGSVLDHLEVDDSPITLYVWAHLVSATMVEHLSDNGVAANVVHIHVDGLTDTAP